MESVLCGGSCSIVPVPPDGDGTYLLGLLAAPPVCCDAAIRLGSPSVFSGQCVRLSFASPLGLGLPVSAGCVSSSRGLSALSTFFRSVPTPRSTFLLSPPRIGSARWSPRGIVFVPTSRCCGGVGRWPVTGGARLVTGRARRCPTVTSDPGPRASVPVSVPRYRLFDAGVCAAVPGGRAMLVAPHFQLDRRERSGAVRLWRWLDGLPLAIEAPPRCRLRHITVADLACEHRWPCSPGCQHTPPDAPSTGTPCLVVRQGESVYGVFDLGSTAQRRGAQAQPPCSIDGSPRRCRSGWRGRAASSFGVRGEHRYGARRLLLLALART